MFSIQAGERMNNGVVLLLFTAIAALVAHIAPNTFELPHKWHTAERLGFACCFCGVLLSLYAGHVSPFLYFQF